MLRRKTWSWIICAGTTVLAGLSIASQIFGALDMFGFGLKMVNIIVTILWVSIVAYAAFMNAGSMGRRDPNKKVTFNDFLDE